MDEITVRVSVLPTGLGEQIVHAFIQSLAVRLDQSARQILVFEAAIEREVAPNSGIETVADLSRGWQRDATPIIRVLDAYPALEGLLAAHVDDSIQYAARFASALSSDWPDAARLCGIENADLSSIGSIEVVSSDFHCGGESVIVVRDATHRDLVAFKPRSLELEARITDAIGQLASRSGGLSGWRLPRYLLRPGYGWVEWLVPKECAAPAEVGQYYVRAGALLGWSVALGVTDLHRDNLISHGDSPVPIDLETSFHHRQSPMSPSRSGLVLPRVMEWNALATGLLPMWIWKGEDRSGVDLSGLGSLGEQWVSLSLQQIVERDTRTERTVRGGVRLYPSGNSVRLGDEEVAPWHYLEDLIEGFDIGLDVLVANRDLIEKLVDEVGSLDARFLARPTAGYHYAIQGSLHPSYMRSVAGRREFLVEALTDTERVEEWLVAAEVEACIWGDIPRFVTTPAGQSVHEPLYGGVGTLLDVEHVSGAEAAVADLPFLESAERRHFERTVIAGAMMSLQTANEELPSALAGGIGGADEGVAFGAGVAEMASKAAAEFVATFAAQGDNPDHWYGFREAPGGHYEFGLLGSDLYSGAPGVAYGLGLGLESGLVSIDVVDSVTRSVAKMVRRRLGEVEHRLGGAYFGELSAVLPVAANLALLDRTDEAREIGAAALTALQAALANPQPMSRFWGIDLLGGAAGGLAVAVSLYRLFGDDDWVPVISELVSIIEGAGEHIGRDFVWRQAAISTDIDGGLCGLSHGQSGCAVALAEAATVESLPESVRSAAAMIARQAVGWELGRYSLTARNFPDYRRRSTTHTDGEFAWSHGVLGTMLALHRISACIEAPDVQGFLDESRITEMLEHAILTRRPPNNSSLSHGSLGNYLIVSDLLRLEGSSRQRESLAALAEWSELSRWAEFESRPLRQHAIDAPGFMVGRAGRLAGWLAAGSSRFDGVPFLPHRFEARIRGSQTGSVVSQSGVDGDRPQ